ncbi:hypothetical protein HD553DRAFT_272098 [Filobasidium floriforme]|uniref:uncharacterized protein n=1 Tax=Filobasidium floriforme TaxID=5210 RepID=UPI001E8D120F|nr:uncharacterized protein HD553DRAFT_272098 [Filobasidium floriforme]KAH8084780.1 hypothetical protein HD553DRAFT_272098 [Filobasidium floriforme]
MERTTTPPPPPTEDELERFRQEWQKELQQQREQRQRHGDAATQRQADAHKTTQAVEQYANAVELEQMGRLNEALQAYRGAYRLDEPGVGDRNDPLTRILFSWLETAREEILHPPIPTDPPVASSSSTRVVPTYKSPYSADRLPQTIHDLYHHLPLLPLEEKDPDSEILLSKLPEEILENVVEFMDVATLERFGSVCKRLRVLTRGVGKWRTLCRQIYRPPILPPEISLSTLVKRHGMDYRTTFLEERRVRYDGVYISVCHYIRPGQSELAWVNVSHQLVTYHRFLRFYPDGTVIALLTTDHPVDVVHNIKPSLRAKGTLMGRWSLSDWDPEMEKDRPPFPPHAHATHPINLISITDLIEPGVAHPKYSFEMNLDLRSAQRGRWNKLVMRDYQSVRLGTGEALGLSLKHQKPFFFSK